MSAMQELTKEDRETIEAAARILPSGFVIVPREATIAMQDVAWVYRCQGANYPARLKDKCWLQNEVCRCRIAFENAPTLWRRMVDAAENQMPKLRALAALDGQAERLKKESSHIIARHTGSIEVETSLLNDAAHEIAELTKRVEELEAALSNIASGAACLPGYGISEAAAEARSALRDI